MHFELSHDFQALSLSKGPPFSVLWHNMNMQSNACNRYCPQACMSGLTGLQLAEETINHLQRTDYKIDDLLFSSKFRITTIKNTRIFQDRNLWPTYPSTIQTKSHIICSVLSFLPNQKQIARQQYSQTQHIRLLLDISSPPHQTPVSI